MHNASRRRIYILCLFNDPSTTEIYALSLHDALPISTRWRSSSSTTPRSCGSPRRPTRSGSASASGSSACCTWTSCRSEEHTSELQSRQYLVCSLLLEKQKKTRYNSPYANIASSLHHV